MYIGNLNGRLTSLEWRVERTGGGAVRLKRSGDPFLGEKLAVAWQELAPAGLDLHFQYSGNVWLNRIVLRFGSRCAPTSVCLYDQDGQTLLDSYHGETGRPISIDTVALSVEGQRTGFVIRIETDLSDIILEGIDLCGAELSGEEVRVYPIPASISLDGESFPVSTYTTVSAEGELAAQAAAILREKWAELTSMELSEAEEATIRLLYDEDYDESAYHLAVSEDIIEIEAGDLRGFVQGVETLCKLIEDGEVEGCAVDDAPFCAFRGVHLYLPAPDQMDFAKRLIKYLLSPMGYNHIIMEVAGAMRFESHPEINEAFLEANRRAAAGEWPDFPHGDVGGGRVVEQEAVRELCDYARRFGIEIIPEVQSLSHVQFFTQAHPELAERAAEDPIYEETDERVADLPPSEFYAHCYCPGKPESYEILFDLIDEVVEVFRPAQYVHIGHDEVYRIGVCPLCRERDPADLFAEDVICIHDYLSSLGLKTMMWADMLQPVTKYKTPSAISMLPRDIVLLDFIWYFHTDKDIEDNLLSRDYSVIMGNLYSSHYPRYESRIRKNGMLGGEVSAWVATDQESLAREGKLYDMLYTAGMLWSESYTSHARYSYDRILSRLLPRLREEVSGVCYPSLCDHRERVLHDGGEFAPDCPECGLDIEVGKCYDSLIFEHTATAARHRIPWKPFEVMGEYTVSYEDGEQVKIPLRYGGNIAYYGRRHHAPLTHPYFRHNGYLTAWETDAIEERGETGQIITIYRYEWINPRPDVAVESIVYATVEGTPEDVFVARVVGIQR